MTELTIEVLKAKLLSTKSDLEKDLIIPAAHINKCDIHDVIEAAEALSTRDKEHRLYQIKLLQLQQLESAIKNLDDHSDIECASCGISILERLNVVPTAQHCISCQTEIEKIAK